MRNGPIDKSDEPVKLPKLEHNGIKKCKTSKEAQSWFWSQRGAGDYSTLDKWNKSLGFGAAEMEYFFNLSSITGLYVFVNTNKLEGKTGKEIKVLLKLNTG